MVVVSMYIYTWISVFPVPLPDFYWAYRFLEIKDWIA